MQRQCTQALVISCFCYIEKYKTSFLSQQRRKSFSRIRTFDHQTCFQLWIRYVIGWNHNNFEELGKSKQECCTFYTPSSQTRTQSVEDAKLGKELLAACVDSALAKSGYLIRLLQKKAELFVKLEE
jgi:hypothetical protein